MVLSLCIPYWSGAPGALDEDDEPKKPLSAMDVSVQKTEGRRNRDERTCCSARFWVKCCALVKLARRLALIIDTGIKLLISYIIRALGSGSYRNTFKRLSHHDKLANLTLIIFVKDIDSSLHPLVWSSIGHINTRKTTRAQASFAYHMRQHRVSVSRSVDKENLKMER